MAVHYRVGRREWCDLGVRPMKWHPIDPDARRFWKAFPLRLAGGLKCELCGEETVLVQSMSGGFVTRNCPKCSGSKYSLSDAAFRSLDLYVSCPSCKARMKADVLRDSN